MGISIDTIACFQFVLIECFQNSICSTLTLTNNSLLTSCETTELLSARYYFLLRLVWSSSSKLLWRRTLSIDISFWFNCNIVISANSYNLIRVMTTSSWTSSLFPIVNWIKSCAHSNQLETHRSGINSCYFIAQIKFHLANIKKHRLISGGRTKMDVSLFDER